MAARIEIDVDECLSCESCAEICPSVFGFDEDTEKAYLINGYDPDEDCIDEAIASCPAECIVREE